MEANAKKFFSSVAISGLEAVTAKRRYLTKCEPKVMEIDDEEKIVKTACRACIANCGVLAHVKNGRVIKLEGTLLSFPAGLENAFQYTTDNTTRRFPVPAQSQVQLL